jgi:predicted nucleic acid-binding protein
LKVLIDTNIVLDVLLERRPFAAAAAEIFSLAEQARLEGFLCATTITTIDCLLVKSLPPRAARSALRKLLSLFEIAPVNRAVIDRALAGRVSDFKDAVLASAGQIIGVDCLITRNAKDFARSGLKVFDPAEFLVLFGK